MFGLAQPARYAARLIRRAVCHDMQDDPEREAAAPPSRSQRRRDAIALFELGEELASLPAARLARMELPDDVRAELANVRRITAPVARKRQLQYLAKLMRRHDDSAFASARAALGSDAVTHRAQVAAEQRLEALRQRLLVEGDTALGELLDRHPHADRQHLRTLLRRARCEDPRKGPLHARRALFRALRALEAGHGLRAGGPTDAIGTED